MRVRHSEIEQLRGNVRGWVSNQGRSSSGPRMSYKHATRMGIYRLHRGDSVRAALRYLERFFDSYSLRSESRRSEGFKDLREYDRWRGADSATSIATKTRIAVALAPNAEIAGEIPRVDLLPDGGYRAILLGDNRPTWETELRMPLIQRAVAQVLRRPEELVGVGVQALDGSGLVARVFSHKEIEEAVSELQDLASEATRLLGQ